MAFYVLAVSTYWPTKLLK